MGKISPMLADAVMDSWQDSVRCKSVEQKMNVQLFDLPSTWPPWLGLMGDCMMLRLCVRQRLVKPSRIWEERMLIWSALLWMIEMEVMLEGDELESMGECFTLYTAF